MAANSSKSRYNERFTFADPTGILSASRSNRYRSKKKRKLDAPPEVENMYNMEEQHQDSECESESNFDEQLEAEPQMQDSSSGADECECDYPDMEMNAFPHNFFNLSEPDEPEELEEFEESSEHIQAQIVIPHIYMRVHS